LNPNTVTCGSVSLSGAGAALAGGRAPTSRRGGWPEPSGLELLGGLAVVADALASERPGGPAFAAMAIPANNAVPRPDEFTNSGHNRTSDVSIPRAVWKGKDHWCDPFSLYHHNF
jgi:hypothetical protein